MTPAKDNIINSLTKETYGKKEVSHLLNTLSSRIHAPDIIKKGDVYINKALMKSRPYVIIKVCKDKVYSIPLTTTNNMFVLCECKSRFFVNSYFTKQLTMVNIKYVNDNFVGIYDNTRHLNIVIRKLSEHIKSLNL